MHSVYLLSPRTFVHPIYMCVCMCTKMLAYLTVSDRSYEHTKKILNIKN